MFLYVGGVKVSEEIGQYQVIPDEPLKFFVISHEQRRHELARAPPVNVRSAGRGASVEVLGNVLDTKMLLPVHRASNSPF